MTRKDLYKVADPEFLSPAYEVRGKVMIWHTSVRLSTGGGGYPGQVSVLPNEGYPPSFLWGVPHLPDWEYPQSGLDGGTPLPPPGMDGTWTGYAASGTPLAVSHRTT